MAFHYSPKITTDGLMLYFDAANSKSYPGTGTAWADISKNHFDATISSASFDADKRGSIVFNGSTSYASGPSISVGSFGTVNVWFKQDSAVNNKGLFSIGSSTFFYIGGSGGNTQISIFNGTSYSGQISIPNKLSWNMATYAWKGGSASLYLNADPSTAVNSSISFATSGAFYIGVYGSLSPSSYFNGRISNVQVYNRRLSFEEISENYTAINSRYN